MAPLTALLVMRGSARAAEDTSMAVRLDLDERSNGRP